MSNEAPETRASRAGAGDALAERAAESARAASRADGDARETVRLAERALDQSPTDEVKETAVAARRTAEDTTDADEAARAAQEAAVERAVRDDELLLDKQAREVAAQATPDQPFGVPGVAASRAGWVRRGFLFAFGGLLAVGLAKAVVVVEQELLLFVVAVFLAVGLDPAVRFLVRRGMRRGFAVTIIAVGFLGGVAAFAAAAVPPLAKEATTLAQEGPVYLKQLHDRHSLLGRLNLQYHLSDRVGGAAGGFDVAGGLLHVGTALVSLTVETVLVVVLVIYLLADLQKITDSFYRLFPIHRRPRVGLLGDEIISRVGGYVLGNVLTSVVAVIGSYAVLAVLHVPYAFVLSVLVGVMDLVPLFGSVIAGSVTALVALAAVSSTAAVVTVGYHIAYRLFEDYFLSPRVLRRTVDVSPLVTIAAVVIGGSLLGIVGALISVPVAAAIQLLLTEVVYPQRDSETEPG